MKTEKLTLEIIFANCNINLTGITWENISILGDKNIEIIAEKISIACKKHFNLIQEFEEGHLVSEKLRQEIKKPLSLIKLKYFEEVKEIKNVLLNKTTGESKPLLPNLRDFETNQSDHMVVYTDPKDSTIMERKWRSAINCHNSNDQFHLLFLFSPEKNEITDNDGLDGLYYRTKKHSLYVMQYEELEWFRNFNDKPFNTLYHQNSVDIAQSQVLWEEKISSISDTVTQDFKKDLQFFKKVFEKKIFKGEETYQKNFLRYIEEQHSHILMD